MCICKKEHKNQSIFQLTDLLLVMRSTDMKFLKYVLAIAKNTYFYGKAKIDLSTSLKQRFGRIKRILDGLKIKIDPLRFQPT